MTKGYKWSEGCEQLNRYEVNNPEECKAKCLETESCTEFNSCMGFGCELCLSSADIPDDPSTPDEYCTAYRLGNLFIQNRWQVDTCCSTM